MRSRSSKGGGADNFNELRFDDKKGSEYVWFQAEKDFHRLVKHDATDEVKDNHKVEIGKNHVARWARPRPARSARPPSSKVGADTSAKVLGDLKREGRGRHRREGGSASTSSAHSRSPWHRAPRWTSTPGLLTVTSTGSVHIKAATSVVIDAGMSMTIKVGGSVHRARPVGVSIVGPMVKNNSGGLPEAPAAPQGQPGRPGQHRPRSSTSDPLPDRLRLPPRRRQRTRCRWRNKRDRCGPTRSSRLRADGRAQGAGLAERLAAAGGVDDWDGLWPGELDAENAPRPPCW